MPARRDWGTIATSVGSPAPQGSRVRPILVVNPRSDPEFVDVANRLVDEGIEQSEDLERALRAQYPSVVVRERLLDQEPLVTWYVYREGSWTPSSQP
jgi:hypothetical protein